ncbi:MAG: hypothetical protein V4519_03450 [Patescibacteria group bacterium]
MSDAERIVQLVNMLLASSNPNPQRVVAIYMDWIIRNLRGLNIALWLKQEKGHFENVAYFKHTVPKTKDVLSALEHVVVSRAIHEGLVTLSASRRRFSHLRALADNDVIAMRLTSLGSVSGVLLVFRHKRQGGTFTGSDKHLLVQSESIFMSALAGAQDRASEETKRPNEEAPPPPQTKPPDPADWWKRGEKPPY